MRLALPFRCTPPKPTNQQVTNVTATEIDMSWQDNAGHQADGYEIPRGEPRTLSSRWPLCR